MKQKRPPHWSKRCEAGVQVMIQNAMPDLRPEFEAKIREHLDRKYTLPACNVSVGALTRRTIFEVYGEEWRTEVNNVLLKSAYARTGEILEEYSATITDFQTVRRGGSAGNRGSYRAIYAFPPLKERKR